MASSSVLADFARRPPAQKVGIFVAIGLLLGAAYYQLVFSGLRKDIKAQEDSKAALARDESKVKADEKQYKELSKKKGELQQIIAENESALPTAAQLPAFFEMLNQRIGEAGVDVKLWRNLPEVPVEEFYKVPLELEIEGTYYEIKKFFYLLYKMSQKEGAEGGAPAPGAAPAEPAGEDRDRILTIEDLAITSPTVVNNELVMRAKFKASTFRKDAPLEPEVDPKAKAKGKDAAKAKDDPKAKKAADPKAGSALDNQAPSPGNAKAKAERAMEREQERIDRAKANQEPPVDTLVPEKGNGR